MRIFALSIYLCIRALFVSAFDDHQKLIEDANLQPVLEQSQYSLIYFFSETCQYCEVFNPTFDYISVLYNNRSQSTKFQALKTDGNRNTRLTQLFSVNSFPTLKLVNFDTKQILDYNYGDRDISSVMEFIQTSVPDIQPNYDNFESKVILAENFDSSAALKDTANDYLVVFTVPYSHEWEEYNFPAHFYQQLASSGKYENTKFVLLDINEVSVNEAIYKFKVSNFPSLIFFSKDGRFKTLRTHSQNYLINDRLDDKDIRIFLDNIRRADSSESSGTWFDSLSQLEEYLEQISQYADHKPQAGYGMNLKQSNGEESLNEEDDYNYLLEHMEL